MLKKIIGLPHKDFKIIFTTKVTAVWVGIIKHFYHEISRTDTGFQAEIDKTFQRKSN